MNGPAIAILEDTIARLRRGEARVVELVASADVISVKLEGIEAARAPVVAAAGDPCPRCHAHPLIDASGTLMCRSCGSMQTGQLPRLRS